MGFEKHPTLFPLLKKFIINTLRHAFLLKCWQFLAINRTAPVRF